MKRIKGFDGIRAISIALVVLAHLHVFLGLARLDLLPYRALPLVSGETGVMAFFVLSGFLITSLLVHEQRETGHVDLKSFYIRRTLRIFPVYFACIFFILLIRFFLNTDISDTSMVYAALYIYNFIPREAYSTTLGHTWSLAVEEHFYLLWPFLFLAFYQRLQARLALYVLGFVITSHVLLVILLNFTDLDMFYRVRNWSFIAGGHIALGCLMALIVLSDLPRLIEQLALPVAGCIGVLLFFCSALIGPAGEHLRPFGIALMICWVYLNQESRIVRSLEIRPMVYIGQISYGIYMYQGIFLATGPYRAPGVGWPPNQSYGLLALLLIAPLSFRYFEKPILRLKPMSRASADQSSAALK
ncbi:MAG: acyltransferase [Rhodobacteraceae bacterium]|nr:acyltransferase [Paracoccaceae bacterium]